MYVFLNKKDEFKYCINQGKRCDVCACSIAILNTFLKFCD